MILEIIGKVVIYGSPVWIPGGLYLWHKKEPESFNETLGPIISEVLYWGEKALNILIISTICAAIFLTVRYIFNRYREKKHYQYYRLLPHAEQKTSTNTVLEMVQQLGGYNRPRYIRWYRGREWFKWMIHRDNGEISFYIGFPEDRKTGILRTIQNAYPKAELIEIEKEKVPMPSPRSYSGRMILDQKGIHELEPLASYKGNNGIGNLISFMGDGTWIDITFSPTSTWKLMHKLKAAQTKVRKKHEKIADMDSFEKADLKGFSQRLTGKDKVFTVAISIVSEHEQAGGVVQSIATGVSSIMNDENGLSFRRFMNPIERCPYPTVYTMDFVGHELANLLLLPHPDHDINEQIPRLQRGERALKPNELNKGISVGYISHPTEKEREVKIPLNVITQHFANTGKTGSGKSSFILQFIQSMIDEWVKDNSKAPTFTLIDPARETALTVISRLIKAEHDGYEVDWEKVHYFSFTNEEYPLPFNLLHRNKGEKIDDVTNNIMDILNTAFDNSGAVRMDRWIKNAIMTLLLDTKEHTILGVMKMFDDDDFREDVLSRITDPIVQNEWKSFQKSVSEATLDAIRTRMAPFQTSIYMRRMFGQFNFAMDIQRWMDEGHIVLIDCKNVDKVNTGMTVGHIVTQYHQQAINRKPGSRVHVLMVDEAHMAAIPIMDTIIAYDRKFGLSLGIITQYLNQLPKWLKDAIAGNMATILSGTQGDEAARQIEDMTNEKFSANYLQDLPANTLAVYTKEKIKGVGEKITTCTVKTDPPIVYKEDGTKADHENGEEMTAAFARLDGIAGELQKRDAMNYKNVDETIYKYMGIAKKNDDLAGYFEDEDPMGGDANTEEELADFTPFTDDSQTSPLEKDSDIIKFEVDFSDCKQTEKTENKEIDEGSKGKVVAFPFDD